MVLCIGGSRSIIRILIRSPQVCQPFYRKNIRMFHLDITAGQSRGEVLSDAVVTEVLDISPTVKKLVLKIDDPGFRFKAGQWVDFYIPGVDTVGGFSIASAPKRLKEKQEIELSIKKSKHPPVEWVHDKCKVGSAVRVRSGGDFTYDPHPSDSPKDLLLLAGGVGINPIRSILLHDKDLQDDYSEKTFGYCPGKAKLLYSAQTVQELIFKDDFMTLSDDKNFHCTLFATRLEKAVNYGSHFFIEPGRVTHLDIMTTFCGSKTLLNKDKLLCYVCGPREMVNSLIPDLEECGVMRKQIIYEPWTVAPLPSSKKPES